MTINKDWFQVDRKGLAKQRANKDKKHIVFELVQNCWDENTTTVVVQLERIGNTQSYRLTVADDNPTGFSDLSHAYTLFAESKKLANPESAVALT